MLLESVLRPASGGFGMYELTESPSETSYNSLDDFTEYMDREYSWRWATELDGKIYAQDGGKPFAWREHGTGTGEENLGIIYLGE